MPDKKGGIVNNLVSKLRKLVIGNTSDDLQLINKSLTKLKHSVGVETKTSNFLELIKAIVNTSDNSQQDLSDIEKLLRDLGLTLAQSAEQDRVSRYTEYERIIEKIPYMKRALKVLTQNICYPEDYSGKIFTIDLPANNEKYKVYKNNIENLVKLHKIEENTPQLVFNTLLYGDKFVEITIAEDILNKYKLLESATYSSWFKVKVGNRDVKITVESVNPNILNMLNEAKDKNKENSSSEEKKEEKTVFLTFHPPHKVIKLGDQEELGYIVVNADLRQLNYASTNIDIHGEQIDKLINSIVLRIRNNQKLRNEIKTREELRIVLAKLLLSTKSNEVVIRYVPPELMQHFRLDEGLNKFKPYGTSVLYGTEYLAKIIIAIQGSIMVQRITRSVDRQLIYVDVGSSRDVRKYIESVKESLQRRRFSIDGVKIDEIPSYVSSFEYLYLPTRDGKRYVEFDQWSQPGDVASRVDDLKALRDALVAAIEVPPAYIGIEENIEARATLVEQSVVFATTVMNYQRTFAKHLKELIIKIAKVNNIIGDDALEEFEIKFQAPLSLLVEKQANYYDNVSRIVETGRNLGIPPTYFIRKYFLLDEQELEELKVEENLKKIFAKQEGEGEEEGLGGFGGGGFEEFGGGEGGEEFNI